MACRVRSPRIRRLSVVGTWTAISRHISTTGRLSLTYYDRSCYLLGNAVSDSSEVGEMVAIETGVAGQTRLARLERSDGPELRRFFHWTPPELTPGRFPARLARPEQAQPRRLLDLDHHDREAVVAVLDGEI